MVAASAVDHQQHPSAQTQSQPQTGVSAAAGTPSSNHPEFSTWLSERGVDQTKISTLPVTRAGYIIDTIVAAADISEGDVILRVPNDLIVTLKRQVVTPLEGPPLAFWTFSRRTIAPVIDHLERLETCAVFVTKYT
jgi:hypothetical protein